MTADDKAAFICVLSINNYTLISQGRSQDLAGGGGVKIIFFQV